MTSIDERPAGAREDFAPPRRLRHPHLQSIYPSLPLRRRAVERRCAPLLRASRDVLVDCGDGVRLLAHLATQETYGRPPATQLAVLLHGWEGSSQSLYVLSLAQSLLDAGYDVVRLNLRDHGDSHHLNEEIFHSCRIAEVVGAVKSLQLMHAGKRLCLAGFSLGGNFSLRVGVHAAAARIDIARIVAICPVLDPEHTLARLESGWALYREYFVWKWRRSLRKKQQAWPNVYGSLGEILSLGNLTDMTDRLAVAYGGFPSLQQYLQGYSIVGPVLQGLAASPGLEVRIIAAADDPIIPASDLERIARPANLEVTLSPFGGHCGFYDGGASPSWIEREVMKSFAAGH
ncbi:MAG TPA: alpha/beta fold hydrolase [Steroidobacteraceae bacterium]|nr:alpha/beta fold hydrolase [Steroidobacteraceae bacterium]